MDIASGLDCIVSKLEISVRLWDEVIVIIRRLVKPQHFELWFRNIKCISFEGNVLNLGVPNLFCQEWIEKRYLEVIREAVKLVVGQSPEIKLVIDGELHRKLRASQLKEKGQLVEESSARPSATGRRLELNPRMLLENFVVGPCNELSYSAACKVAEKPMATYNPLFVHGMVGLGKTHLIQGICNRALSHNPSLRMIYLSAESFTNQFLSGLKHRSLDGFRDKFRNADLLVIDDIHFLAAKSATQDEFLHTFNSLDGMSRQIVMASDSHPKHLTQLKESLVNRFISGLVVEIRSPSPETRRAIILNKLGVHKKKVDPQVIDHLARNIRGNVREIEGIITSLVAYMHLSREKIDLATCRRVLSDLKPANPHLPNVRDIEKLSAEFYGVTPADIASSRRSRQITLARRVAMYLTREIADMSYQEIGSAFGGKNHSTASTACKSIEKQIQNNQRLAEQVRTIKERLVNS